MDDYSFSGRFKEVTQTIHERVQELDFVLAFWVGGSHASGRARKDSDINYSFLITDIDRYDELKAVFRDLISWRDVPGPYPEQQWEVATLKEDAQSFKDIGWHVITPEDLEPFEELFSDKIIPHKGERWVHGFKDTHLLRYQGDARKLFLDAKILYDQEGVVADVQRRIKKYPDKVAGGVCNWALNRLRKRLPWHGNPWKIHDKFCFINHLHEDLHYIAIAHYAKNKQFPMDDLRHYEEDLKTLKPDIKELVHALVAYDDVDKSKIMTEIIDELNTDRDE